MKNTIYCFGLASIMLLIACGDAGRPEVSEAKKKLKKSTEEYDPKRGEGKFDHVELDEKLNVEMAAAGGRISGVKCLSCHKLTDERLVGPGWKGVTERRKPAWLMNFFTNPDPMIDKDPELQAQLELCLVRMPNQDIADEEARQILEYMRQNDGVQP